MNIKGATKYVLPICAALSLGGCKTRLWEIPVITRQDVKTSCKVEDKVHKVDLLFLVDNSTSMDSMQDELKRRFPEFLQVFRDLATRGVYVDLHLGVVTSDYGAGKNGFGNCEPSPGGQKGLLQAIGQFAKAECKPPMGANYAQYVFAQNGDGVNNLPPGQSLEQTFTCMASVGARGCGYEHQLESVHAALHGGLPENAGFVRDDALLVVLFLTNEDDCSAPPDSDLFDPYQTFKYGYLGGAGYRCTRYGVVCGNPAAQLPYGSSNGPLSECAPAPNPGGAGPGKLFDVTRYTSLFTLPASQGGVSFDPNDVMLVGIAGPAQPFEVILADPGTGQGGMAYTQCSMLNDQSSPVCVPALQHSCINPTTPAFFADPAVRIATVIHSAAHSAISSICDGSYTSALVNVAQLIGVQIGDCCLSEPLPLDPRTPTDPASWIADCTVEQITRNADGSAITVELPSCSVDGSVIPCWRVAAVDQCSGASPQGIGVVVNRGGMAPPAHTSIQATCKGASTQ